MSVTTDPLAAAITDAVIGAGMRVGRNRLQAVVEQAIIDHRKVRPFAEAAEPVLVLDYGPHAHRTLDEVKAARQLAAPDAAPLAKKRRWLWRR